eukprot:GHUV01047109.1.p1 GENE.GHUV01047109.1~~GHUV01047109.1.p1  ORF type:complete len:231 (+),score=59.13 GHUV01047109.1:394-1086(+)
MQVFPPRAAGSRPPVLLQTLEAQLLEATNTASRAASAGPHQIRDPQLAANLALDCHRKVFQSFIDGFGVYGPLLSQIKRVFNRAIEDGLKDGLENSELRQQLLEVRREQAAAEAAGRAEVIDGKVKPCKDLIVMGPSKVAVVLPSGTYLCAQHQGHSVLDAPAVSHVGSNRCFNTALQRMLTTIERGTPLCNLLYHSRGKFCWHHTAHITCESHHTLQASSLSVRSSTTP